MGIPRQLVSIAAVLSLGVSPGLGQQKEGKDGARPSLDGQAGRPGMTGPILFRLLTQKPVQEELKLTPDQVKKVVDATHNLRDQMKAKIEEGQRDQAWGLVQEHQKVLFSILKPDQGKRLKQLALQLQGAGAFNQPEVAREMKITDEQRKKFHDLHRDTIAAVNKLYDDDNSTRQEVKKKTNEIFRATNNKIFELLNDEQKAKWKAMMGEYFKGELQRGKGGLLPG
jgi:hypothetical protein